MNTYSRHMELVRSKCNRDIVTDVDGFKKWWPPGMGYLTSDDLRIIADYLDELNKDWDEEVQKL